MTGHEPAAVRAVLAYLRRARYPLLPLAELVQRLVGEGPPVNGAVAFTIDDGYADHAEVAAPTFAEFDCPVTTFITTGFVDGTEWMWWDRIEYAFTQSRRARATLHLDNVPLTYTWTNHEERSAAQSDFTDRCKRVDDRAKHRGIEALAVTLEVELPTTPPPQYAPMSWDQLRAAEQRGMTFGPHTITHPILSRVPDAQAQAEIAGSWKRLCAQARTPVPIFCYPNGQSGDFGEREEAILRATGLAGAVVGWAGYADARDMQRRAAARWEIRRFAEGDRLAAVAQSASGLAWLRIALRGGTP